MDTNDDISVSHIIKHPGCWVRGWYMFCPYCYWYVHTVQGFWLRHVRSMIDNTGTTITGVRSNQDLI